MLPSAISNEPASEPLPKVVEPADSSTNKLAPATVESPITKSSVVAVRYVNVPPSVNSDEPPPPQLANVKIPGVPEFCRHSLALPTVVGSVNTKFPDEFPGVRVVVWPPLPSFSTSEPVDVLVPIVAVLP